MAISVPFQLPSPCGEAKLLSIHNCGTCRLHRSRTKVCLSSFIPRQILLNTFLSSSMTITGTFVPTSVFGAKGRARAPVSTIRVMKVFTLTNAGFRALITATGGNARFLIHIASWMMINGGGPKFSSTIAFPNTTYFRRRVRMYILPRLTRFNALGPTPVAEYDTGSVCIFIAWHFLECLVNVSISP
jgi:hypothetical protein